MKRKITIIIIILLFGFICLFISMKVIHNQEKIIVRYNKIEPDYEPKDIIIRDKEYIELFKQMLKDGVEQSREKNPKNQDKNNAIYGSFIAFKEKNRDTRTEYILRGTNLEVKLYETCDKSSSCSELIQYKIPEKYHEKWVEYCVSHS